MNRKYVVIVHGLMIKNGTVAPYGTPVTEGIEVDDTEGKVAQGYLLSQSDFDKKVKEDEKGMAAAKNIADAAAKANTSGTDQKAIDAAVAEALKNKQAEIDAAVKKALEEKQTENQAEQKPGEESATDLLAKSAAAIKA